MLKITEGILKKVKQPYEVRVLNVSHLSEIIKLQNHVYEQLADKSKLACLSEEEFKILLLEKGLMIGVYVNNNLIAVRALLDPENDPNHLGLAIGLAKTDLDKVIYQEVSFVHPDYQGNGLQKIMATSIMDEFNKTNHHYLYVCATVAPHNIPSLKDKFAQHMEIKALITIYGGKQRYVFAKDLTKHPEEKEVIYEEYIQLNNIHSVKKFLDLNYVGVNIINKNTEYHIKMRKFK